MSDPGQVLKDACDAILADPDLRPDYDKSGKLLRTFCNCGLRRVAQAVGCQELDDPNATADIMLGIVKENKSGRWKRGTGSEATIHALSGGLAIAGMSSSDLGEAHGHVCVVYPVGMQRSNSLGKDVPMVANVGPGDQASPLVDVKGRPGIKTRNNWLCSVSWAFPCKRLEKEPDYFLWGRA